MDENAGDLTGQAGADLLRRQTAPQLPSISVIVPIYNDPANLKRRLLALAASDHDGHSLGSSQVALWHR